MVVEVVVDQLLWENEVEMSYTVIVNSYYGRQAITENAANLLVTVGREQWECQAVVQNYWQKQQQISENSPELFWPVLSNGLSGDCLSPHVWEWGFNFLSLLQFCDVPVPETTPTPVPQQPPPHSVPSVRVFDYHLHPLLYMQSLFCLTNMIHSYQSL